MTFETLDLLLSQYNIKLFKAQMQKLVDRATSSQIYLRKCDFLKENTSRIAKIAKISIEETTRLLGMIASTCRFPKNKVCGPEAAQES